MARDRQQRRQEEHAVELIMQDVTRRAALTKSEDRVRRLNSDVRREGGDFVFFAAHIGGKLKVFLPSEASGLER